MHFNTNIIQNSSHLIRGLLKPARSQYQATLTRQDLQRIVAAMVD